MKRYQSHIGAYQKGFLSGCTGPLDAGANVHGNARECELFKHATDELAKTQPWGMISWKSARKGGFGAELVELAEHRFAVEYNRQGSASSCR